MPITSMTAQNKVQTKSVGGAIQTASKDMAKLTVTTAKKQIIKQIKKHGGLFENCGQKEIRQLKDQIENKFFLWDEKCEELQLWIESLDSSTIQQYL